MRFVLPLVFVLYVAAQRLVAQSDIAIIHGRIIDGNGGAPVEDGAVVIRGDRIVAVGPMTAVSIPRSARTIDARGKSVLPGLADLHVHLGASWDDTFDFLGYRKQLNAFLYAGVTTVLDTGGDLWFVSQLRQEVAAGRLAGPTIHLLGPLIDGADPTWPTISVAVSSYTQFPPIVKWLKRAGVDGVKAYGGLSYSQLFDLAAAAEAESLHVFLDAGSRGNGVESFAQTGIHTFAHLGSVPATDALVNIMRNRGVSSLTTLATAEAATSRRTKDLVAPEDALLAGMIPTPERQKLAARLRPPVSRSDSALERSRLRVLAAEMANAKRLFDSGILLAAGTDAVRPGVYYGESLHRELALLVEAGLTPLQAITTATSNAAKVLREANEWGTLESGKRADVLIVDGNPAVRISDTRNVAAVIQRGRLLDRATLRFDAARDGALSGVQGCPFIRGCR